MRYICPECGSEIPEDSEFCHSCGRKKDNTIRLDQAGNFIPPETDICASCGAKMSPDDMFCRSCGQPLSRTQMVVFRPRMVKYGWVGLILALVPGVLGFMPDVFGTGLYSIYGLGHLYFKKWKRGAIFLMISVFMFFIKSGMDESLLMTLMFVITSLFVYFMQAMEVVVLAFMPPKTAE
ncbi:MAG: zinc-ribbon domain-containing protein [Methanomassiliicoccaceae archaeon]|nr:zinc-ribbon domain-containing protein [Methanomassiliicoccaceae archaeon]